MWVRIPASPNKKLDGNDGPLDGRKTNKNNKESHTKKKYFLNHFGVNFLTIQSRFVIESVAKS